MNTRVLGHQERRRQVTASTTTTKRKSMSVDGRRVQRERAVTSARKDRVQAQRQPGRRPSTSMVKSTVNKSARAEGRGQVNRQKAVVLARRIASRLINAQEKILLEAEQLVKEGFPARYVSAALTRLQRRLREQGIWSQFDKTVDRKSLKATANEQCTEDDRDEAINEIATCVCDETNELLDKCDKTISSVAAKHFALKRVAARIMRGEVERILYTRGLEFKF